MEWIIILLFIIILLLVFYLFLMKKEMTRIIFEMKQIRTTSSNALVHTENSSIFFKDIIDEMNSLLIENRLDKLSFEKKKENLQNMMTNISHDLRTPLTSALGYMDMIVHSNLKEEEKTKNLQIVFQRLKRLEELIETFFELSKMKQQMTLEKMNLIGVLENCIAHYYEDYQKEKRKIIFQTQEPKMMIFSNAAMLSRIFDNLISNALKHGKGNLQIRVQKNHEIIFTNTFQNPELEIDKIFDQFYTSDSSRTSGNTGLGLAISKELIEALGGSISAKKEQNKLEIKIVYKK